MHPIVRPMISPVVNSPVPKEGEEELSRIGIADTTEVADDAVCAVLVSASDTALLVAWDVVLCAEIVI